MGKRVPRGKRSRPTPEDHEEQTQHNYDHRGDTGKYGNIYKEDVPMWKPGEGEHEFMVVPYNITENSVFRKKKPDFNMAYSEDRLKEGRAWPEKLTVLIHTGVGVNMDNVVCLRTLDMDCPICERRQGFYDLADSTRDKDKAEDAKKKADQLAPMKRALFNVLVFDSQKEFDKGVQVFEAPHSSIADVLAEALENKRTGEKRFYTIPEEGWNCFYERKGKGLNTEYRQVSIVDRREEDKLTDEQYDYVYENAFNFDDIVVIRDYDEIAEMISGGGGPEQKEEPTPEERAEESRGGGMPGRGERTPRAQEKEQTEEPPAEEPPAEEGNDEPIGPDNLPDEYKDCFGLEANDRKECETCPDEIFEPCYEACEKAKK